MINYRKFPGKRRRWGNLTKTQRRGQVLWENTRIY